MIKITTCELWHEDYPFIGGASKWDICRGNSDSRRKGAFGDPHACVCH
jgi:hypothetical protein